MAIHKMVREAAFGPEDVARLIAAYEAALEALHLVDRSDPVTEIVAKKIIEVYLTGDHDPPHVCARAIKQFGIPLPDKESPQAFFIHQGLFVQPPDFLCSMDLLCKATGGGELDDYARTALGDEVLVPLAGTLARKDKPGPEVVTDA